MYAAAMQRINAIKSSNPGYLSALSSGYLLMAANLLVQFALTPFYLKYLGDRNFGLLMIILNMINFAAIGITWMSGGLVRVMGEYWSVSDLTGYRNAFVVGKYVFTLYALFAVSIGLVAWSFSKGGVEGSLFTPVLLAGLYLIMNYEAIPERQAFISSNYQAMGNLIELGRILLFAGLTYMLLPQLKDMSAIWIALLAGVLFQRIITAQYWRTVVGDIGWRKFTPAMKPIFKRLAGRQGVGYVSYGALLLILQADTMIIGFIGGAEAAGKFVLLWKIPEAIGLLLWKIPSTIEPKVIHLDAAGEQRELRTMFVQGRRWFFGLVVLVSLLYMLTGHWITEIWVGEHAPAEQWMYIAGGFALFFNAFARWPISFSYALIRLPALTKVALIEVLGKVVLMIILFPYLGIAAPIIALIIVHVAYVAWGYQKTMMFGVEKV